MKAWTEWQDAPFCDYAVVGDPIHHSRSPVMHQAAYRALGLDLDYRAVRVPLKEFDEALDHLTQLGIKGLNCTLPLKGAARSWAEARGGLGGNEMGCLPGPSSVNTLNLVDQTGISTDEAGFLALLNSAAPGQKSPLLILGAGGTGQAVAARLTKEEWPLYLWNRTPGRWQEIVDSQSWPAAVLPHINLDGIGVLVNATSAGLGGGSLEIDWSRASSDLVVIDLLYGKETDFLREAKEAGLRTHDGLMMLVEQGALAFEWWLNQPAPRSAMLQAVHGHS